MLAAQAELESAQESLRKAEAANLEASGAVGQFEVARLQAALELAKVKLEKAAHPGRRFSHGSGAMGNRAIARASAGPAAAGGATARSELRAAPYREGDPKRRKAGSAGASPLRPPFGARSHLLYFAAGFSKLAVNEYHRPSTSRCRKPAASARRRTVERDWK